MRERIAKAITSRLPTKDKERQFILLNAASISTLHAFCQNLLRQYFHQLGLDPKFRLANPQEIELLKIDVLDELFEHNYDLLIIILISLNSPILMAVNVVTTIAMILF